MIYDELANYYDALVKDDEATKAWCKLIQSYLQSGELLELACGSGEITHALAQRGFKILASDISEAMLAKAKMKGEDNIEYQVIDMAKFALKRSFNGILCLCDSFNYLLNDEDVLSMFQCVYNHLKPNGYFIVDMHTRDRLEEFGEEYNEAGKVLGCEYQWCILSENDRIYQNFAFYDEQGHISLEQHTQRVYDPIWIKMELEKLGFEVNIKTDFVIDGIQHGEKWFYICKKVKL